MRTLGTEDPVHHMAKYRNLPSAFDFALDMERAGKILGIESVALLARYTALQLDALIVAKTPVDKGRARANWFVSEGVMRTDTTESTKPEPRPKLTGKTIIFISNSLPYIIPLEYGHSKQHPEGMVRKSIEDLRNNPTLGVMK